MEDFYELNNDTIDLKKLQNNRVSKRDFYHYFQIHPNHYNSEKNSLLSEDERQNYQKNITAIKEVFGINSQNIQNENVQLENFDNNQNNKDPNITNEEININSINNSLKENENSNSNSNIYGYNSGRWIAEEHQKFIEGILKYGNEWKKVQNVIKTRTSTQARSHAQKFFLRLKRDLPPDDLSNQDKLFEYILNSCYNSKNNLILTNEQKEKLLTVIRSNLKAEEMTNKAEKDLLTDNNKNNFISGKNFEEFDEFIDDEDNLGYNKPMENEVLGFVKKMSCDFEEKKRKNTFCSRKRKSSSDMSFNNNFNKIFSITKDINHKRSIDISKDNHFIINNLQSKDDKEKNNNNKFDRKININNNNYIFNKNININNNFVKNNNRNNHETVNNITVNNLIIHNNIFQICNCINEPNNINNNKFNNKNLFMNNNKINNYQNAISRTVIFNPDIKASIKTKKNNIQNNSNENENNKQNNIPPSNKNESQDNSNKMYEIEQNNPFNIDFKDFIFDTNNNSTNFNKFSEPHNNEMTEGIKTMSDQTNNLFKND